MVRIMSGESFDESCIFCRIIRGDFGTVFVTESERVVAFNDINPAAEFHVLVVPREHIATLHEVTDPSLYADCLSLAAQVVEQSGLQNAGYRVTSNNGAGAGQSVSHLHFHITSGKRLKKQIG